jgi:hypothetical protein
MASPSSWIHSCIGAKSRLVENTQPTKTLGRGTGWAATTLWSGRLDRATEPSITQAGAPPKDSCRLSDTQLHCTDMRFGPTTAATSRGGLQPTQSGRWALPGRRLVIDGMRSSIGHDRQADPRGGDESFGIGEGVDLHRKPVPRTRIVATRIREDLPIHRHAAQNTLRVSSATFASGVVRDHTGVSEQSDCRHSPGSLMRHRQGVRLSAPLLPVHVVTKVARECPCPPVPQPVWCTSFERDQVATRAFRAVTGRGHEAEILTADDTALFTRGVHP